MSLESWWQNGRLFHGLIRPDQEFLQAAETTPQCWGVPQGEDRQHMASWTEDEETKKLKLAILKRHFSGCCVAAPTAWTWWPSRL